MTGFLLFSEVLLIARNGLGVLHGKIVHGPVVQSGFRVHQSLQIHSNRQRGIGIPIIDESNIPLDPVLREVGVQVVSGQRLCKSEEKFSFGRIISKINADTPVDETIRTKNPSK